MEITLDKVIDYLKKDDCKVVKIDNSLYIYDVKKIQPVSHNKDLRLLNEMAEQYVKVNYPLFSKELNIDTLEVVDVLFPYLKVNREKFKTVKPFKKIVRKATICSVNDTGQVIVRNVIRRKNIS